MTPADIARDYDVAGMDVYKVMREMKLNVTRMGAQLNTRQEKMLRTYFENVAKSRELGRRARERAAAAQAAPSPPPRSPAPVPADPPFKTYFKNCACCALTWAVANARDNGEAVCVHCRRHYALADEPIERRLERAETHARLYREQRDAAFEQARASHEAAEQAWKSRASWRAALVEVMLDHGEEPGDVCWCGKHSPCRTWRKLEEANRGIHRSVESWSAWNDTRLQEFLYGEERATRRRWVIDEDEPQDDELA